LRPAAFAFLRFAASPTGFEPAFVVVVLRRVDLFVLPPNVALLPLGVRFPPFEGLERAPVALDFVPEAPDFPPDFAFASVTAVFPPDLAFASVAAAFPPDFAFVAEAAAFPLPFAFASAFGASARFSDFTDPVLFPTDRGPAFSVPVPGAARFPDGSLAFTGFFRAALRLIAVSDI
jgi:hypothetical protein